MQFLDIYNGKYASSLQTALLRILWCATAFIATYATHAETLGSPEADSLVRVLYEHIFTDYSTAQRYLDTLRQLPEVEPYQLNRIEGDIVFNQGNYFEALKFYKRGLYDMQAEHNDEFQMKMLRRILLCYNYTRNLQRIDYYTNRLQTLAEQHADSSMIAVAQFNRGKLELAQGDAAKGTASVERAIGLLLKSESPTKINDICFYYITLVEALQDSSHNREAMSTIGKMLAFINSSSDTQSRTSTLIDEGWLKDIEAHKAVLYSRLGQPDSARFYFNRFRDSDAVFEYDYNCIMPYLTENHLYDEIIDLSKQRQQFLINAGDTLGPDMAFIYNSLGEAYMKKGETALAATNFQALGALQEAMKHAEEQSAIDELTNNYEERQSQIEHERRIARTKQNATLCIVVLALLCGAGIAMRERHNARIIMKKNRWMAQTIDNMRAGTDAPADTGTEHTADASGEADTTDDIDRRIYDRLISEITRRKLYLNCDLTRDFLLEQYNIPKNKFAILFKNYGHTTYTQFINSLRLDYAIKLLNNHPNYTIDAIARECGIASTVTLYKLFSQKYGMTPTEYRKTLSERGM